MIVGGSLFYLDLLFHKLERPYGEEPTLEQRRWVSKLIDEDHSLDLSFSRLACQNPQILYGIDVNSRRRIEAPLLLQHTRDGKGPVPAKPYGILMDRSSTCTSRKTEISYHGIFLNSTGARLKRAIDRRCLEMLDAGLLEETSKFKKYLDPRTVPGSSIGYKQSLEFLQEAKNTGTKASDLDPLFQRYLIEFLGATRRYASFQSRYCKKYLSQLSYMDVEAFKGDKDQISPIFMKLADLVLPETSHDSSSSTKFFQKNHESAESLHVFQDKREALLYKPDLGVFAQPAERLAFLETRVVPLLSSI